jgi:predicted flap endonuclease-1-like 5' DNA nuclease
MIRDLMQGKLDLNNAPHEAAYKSKAVPAKETAAKPAPVSAPKAAPPPAPGEPVREKSLDDIILDFLAQEQKEREQRK